jgi:hypothetical protein
MATKYITTLITMADELANYPLITNVCSSAIPNRICNSISCSKCIFNKENNTTKVVAILQGIKNE